MANVNNGDLTVREMAGRLLQREGHFMIPAQNLFTYAMGPGEGDSRVSRIIETLYGYAFEGTGGDEKVRDGYTRIFMFDGNDGNGGNDGNDGNGGNGINDVDIVPDNKVVLKSFTLIFHPDR